MTPREKLLQRIENAQDEIRRAGPLHRRDMQRHLRRLLRDLRDYDRFRREQSEV